MKWSQITDVGKVRSGNEDSMCACPDIGLFAVADGMGGHKAGEIASSTALNYLEENLRDALKTNSEVAVSLQRIMQEANYRIYRMSSEFAEYKGMGTTVTAGLIIEKDFYLAHIGDSRAYLLRGEAISQLTDDHSLVGEMLRQGGITEEQALNHPQRNILTRAMGTAPTMKFDFYHLQLEPRDRILLCTDGLTNHLRPEEIRLIAESQPELDRCLEVLLETALGRGGLDNIAMVMVEIE
ncbi:Stp1/IreP family PP2C-type Ser/Thr phosphatase [Desulforamulus aeronauticus]|uniref:Protein phosphatase n=1 Tax=Desulforamulus aeronauticus DSM 10349 TaxID=1121421 RepID=A0A1M6NJM6_9FIRM|nr:Stp1/IreP family PP2C-type Ser/Thr phosphatase [Desulforamulus aeronauticus]SHJ95869.1 protein phosphatase [Desulforamulus aeronauticus DSM 10349]